jgi:protein-tyrosine kinase
MASLEDQFDGLSGDILTMGLSTISGTRVVTHMETTLPAEKTVGELLIDVGLLKLNDVENIERCQKELNLRFGEAAVVLGLVREADIVRMLANQFEYDYLQPGEGGFSPELIAAYRPFSKQVEALRNLRTQIKLRSVGHNQQTLAVIGTNSGDGCTYIAANLATVFSQLGERTVLVDANLRKPRQHQVFNLSQRQGLSDLLAGRCGREVITKIPQLNNLSVLPAGTLPPNPQELLSRPTFDALLKELACDFNLILIDTAPSESFADNQIISSKANNALIVVRKHQTRTKDILTLTKQLRDAKVNCIGAVLNEM